MSAYLWEAAFLAAETPHNLCPSTDALTILDEHPEIRLVLEDTWTDPSGRVYRDVAADEVPRWPAHIAKSFKTFLAIGGSPTEVIQLLDLLKELEADQAVVQMTTRGCRKHGGLKEAITYYENLVAELRSVTSQLPVEEVPLGVSEPSFRPQLHGEDADAGVWYLPERENNSEDQDRCSPCHRAELLHDPMNNSSDIDWLACQTAAYRTLYYKLKRGTTSDLAKLKKTLLEGSQDLWGPSQWRVLWDVYRQRRNYLREQAKTHTTGHLGITAIKLIARIGRATTKRDLSWVGLNLYRAMKGDVQLPGPVSESEWSVVFDCYRACKVELCEVPELKPSLR